jgi:hypothetical protein
MRNVISLNLKNMGWFWLSIPSYLCAITATADIIREGFYFDNIKITHEDILATRTMKETFVPKEIDVNNLDSINDYLYLKE